jgi:class 3 adenylate cyclase
LLQSWALALARSGAASKANALMERLAAQGLRDEETLGLLARTYKDLWLQTGDATRLRQARDAYLQAHALTGGTWSGINAATLALVSGDVAQARQLAEHVLQVLEPTLRRFGAADAAAPADGPEAYWDYATIGEAALILDRHDLVGWAYANAARVSAGQLGNRASSLRNAELVLRRHGAARHLVEQQFQPPQVVLFTGDRQHAPGRQPPQVRPGAERAMYERILDTLRHWQTQIGFSSAAAGADILFLEALQELGAETNIVLPHPPELFIQTSVACADDAHADWVKRFERALENARQVTVLADSVGDEMTYHFSGMVMAGLATLRSSQLYGELRTLTAQDLDAGHVGGADEPTPVTPQAAQGVGTAKELLRSDRQRIISMLFADAVGFSKLAENQIPLFVERFLGGVRAVMDRQAQAPLTCNTWGDGLYFTFDSVVQANDFALDLSDFVNSMNWASDGLPAEMSLRIGLHAGPAFEILDPVTRLRCFNGSHVSRAARIEPVTPPGYVYCSEAHAALVALANNAAYHCEFVGNLPFAKNYGVFPTYSLKRRAAI